MAAFLSRLDAAVPEILAGLAQRVPQNAIAADLTTNKTTVSLAKSGERMIDDRRKLALLGYCVACGLYEPLERLLSPDPRRPDVVILRLPEGVAGDRDPTPELLLDTIAEGEFLTHFERRDHDEARAAWRRMGAAWIGWGRDLDALEAAPDRPPRRSSRSTAFPAGGDGAGAAVTPKPSVQ